MSRILVIADVHGNLPALEAVLAHCGRYDSVWFLGDTVDIGPWPRECVEIVRRISVRGVVGNHDVMVLQSRSAKFASRDGNPDSQSSQFARWRRITRDALHEPDVSFLARLPDHMTVEAFGRRVLLLHHPYPHRYFDRDSSPREIASAFVQPVDHDLVLFGHSHTYIDREVDSVRYVCVPSVGQPRDLDVRAGYVVIEDGALLCHRIDYDIDRTVTGIERLPLAEWFIRKWVRSVRTADLSEWHAKR